MSFEMPLRNVRDVLRFNDSFTRLSALTNLVKQPNASDRNLLEDLLSSNDTTISLLAFLGLKKLYPAPAGVRACWKELFGESVDLLTKRACAGPAQLRIAALKALAFAPEHLSFGLIERVLKSLDTPLSYETILNGQSPSLTLVQPPQKFFLPEGFAVLLASLPGGHDRVNLLRRELNSQESARLLPALIALQLNPATELTDTVLSLARTSEKRIALEAAKALLACGGNKVIMVILSLLKETSDPVQKARLLPVAASTGREEVWNIISSYAEQDNTELALAALHAAAAFPVPSEEKARVFVKQMKNAEPAISATAAQFAWQLGSMKALRLLEKFLASDSINHRICAAQALGGISPDTATPILAANFDKESNGDVVRQMILTMRTLLPEARRNPKLHDLILPWLARLIKSSDPFKRSQTAVLCGLLGKSAQDTVLKALEVEHHPHVIASLLSALGSSGFDRILIYSRFHDHVDSRVRANMINAMLACGGEAVAYFTRALKDNTPRVRSAAARCLFLLGQLDIVATLNRMLLVPEPLSVLAGCHALAQLLRIQPPMLHSDHPLPLALARKTRRISEETPLGPELLNDPAVPRIFNELAIANGNYQKIVWILEENHRKFPTTHAITRMLAAFFALTGEFSQAISALEICRQENPGILADVLDHYRLAIKLGQLEQATNMGNAAKELYAALLDGCMHLCRDLRGSGAELMMEKLLHLQEPSMNLYNAMIQLKVLENDPETVLDLMSELVLARPHNPLIIRKLATMLPESFAELRQALESFANSLNRNP